MSSSSLECLQAMLRRAADGGSAQLAHVLYRSTNRAVRRGLGEAFRRELWQRARAADLRGARETRAEHAQGGHHCTCALVARGAFRRVAGGQVLKVDVPALQGVQRLEA